MRGVNPKRFQSAWSTLYPVDYGHLRHLFEDSDRDSADKMEMLFPPNTPTNPISRHNAMRIFASALEGHHKRVRVTVRASQRQPEPRRYHDVVLHVIAGLPIAIDAVEALPYQVTLDR